MPTEENNVLLNDSSHFRVPTSILQSSKARIEKLQSRQAEREAGKKEPEPPTQQGPKEESLHSKKPRKKWSVDKPTSTTTSFTSTALSSSSSSLNHLAPSTSPLTPPKNTLAEIQRIKEARALRRQQAEWIKEQREGKNPEELISEAYTTKIEEFRSHWRPLIEKLKALQQGLDVLNMPIQVCLRKRPMSLKELDQKAFDVITTATSQFPNARVFVHEPKLNLDQSRSLATHSFQFDQVFDELAKNQEVYEKSLKPLLLKFLKGKNVSLFCYGQTSSGKTHTLFGPEGGKLIKKENDSEVGLYYHACTEIFELAKESNLSFHVSFLELYSGKLFDLLNNHSPVKLLEKDGNFQFLGLKECPVSNLEMCLGLMQKALDKRTTTSTDLNSTSSRSHAIFRFRNRLNGALLTLIDLAGSERAMDNGSSSKETRRESASINQSLLALKECIRALHLNETYIPYRSNKLTRVLRECFQDSMCVMMLNIAPTQFAIEQTLSCLHYAQRLKAYAKKTEEESILMGSERMIGKEVWMDKDHNPKSLKGIDPALFETKHLQKSNPLLSKSKEGGAITNEKRVQSPSFKMEDESNLQKEILMKGKRNEQEAEPVFENTFDSESNTDSDSSSFYSDRESEDDSDVDHAVTPSASRMNLYTSNESLLSNGTSTPEGARTPQPLTTSSTYTSLTTSLTSILKLYNQMDPQFMELHSQVMTTGKQVMRNAEALLKNCLENEVDLDEYKKQLDIILDEHLKDLFRLKAALIGK